MRERGGEREGGGGREGGRGREAGREGGGEGGREGGREYCCKEVDWLTFIGAGVVGNDCSTRRDGQGLVEGSDIVSKIKVVIQQSVSV